MGWGTTLPSLKTALDDAAHTLIENWPLATALIERLDAGILALSTADAHELAKIFDHGDDKARELIQRLLMYQGDLPENQVFESLVQKTLAENREILDGSHIPSAFESAESIVAGKRETGSKPPASARRPRRIRAIDARLGAITPKEQ
jgi:hypothetical protein